MTLSYPQYEINLYIAIKNKHQYITSLIINTISVYTKYNREEKDNLSNSHYHCIP